MVLSVSVMDVSFSVGVLLMTVVGVTYLIRLCATWQPNFAQPVPQLDAETIELMDRKAHLLEDLRDLELDYQMGKIPESDYWSFKKRLEPQAIAVLKALESRGYGAMDDDVLLDEASDDDVE